MGQEIIDTGVIQPTDTPGIIPEHTLRDLGVYNNNLGYDISETN